MGAPNPDVTALVTQLALQHWTVSNTPDLAGVIAAVNQQLGPLGGEINPPLVAFATAQLDALFATQEATESAHGSTIQAIEQIGPGLFTAAGTIPELLFKRANGAVGSPTQITGSFGLGLIAVQGFTSGGHYGVNTAQILFVSNEAFTDTAQGSSIRFLTTPIGTIVPVLHLLIGPDGVVSFGSKSNSTASPGNATLNTVSGRSAIAAGAATVTITNSVVTATSSVFAVLQTNDATAILKNVVPAAGSFVVNLTAAATANTNFAWLVFG